MVPHRKNRDRRLWLATVGDWTQRRSQDAAALRHINESSLLAHSGGSHRLPKVNHCFNWVYFYDEISLLESVCCEEFFSKLLILNIARMGEGHSERGSENRRAFGGNK